MCGGVKHLTSRTVKKELAERFNRENTRLQPPAAESGLTLCVLYVSMMSRLAC